MKRSLCFLFLIAFIMIVGTSFSNTAYAEIQKNIPSTSAKGMILIEKQPVVFLPRKMQTNNFQSQARQNCDSTHGAEQL